MNRLLIVPALALLAVASCSGSPGEDPQSSSGAISPVLTTVITNVHVTSDASSVTITYARLVTTPFTVTLTGPGGRTTRTDGLVGAKTGAQFTGLDECTSYQFAILEGGTTLQSGTIHTLQTGGVACPASETLQPTKSYVFEGAYHWRNNAPWCSSGDWSPALEMYPLNEPGWSVRIGGQPPVSYRHYWNPGAQPLPCQEQFVDVQRSMFEWTFDASRTRRMRTATFEATLDPMDTQICINQIAQVDLGAWAVTAGTLTATNDFGQPWSSVLPVGIGNGRSIDTVQGSTGIPLTFSGRLATADVTSMAARGWFNGGFAIPNDGFPAPTGDNPDHTRYPEDNNACGTGFDSVAMNLTYAPIAPDTPMNCSVAMNCNQFTVTCDGSPDAFEVHQNRGGADVTMAIAFGSVGATTVSMSSNFSNASEAATPLTVCTASSEGAGALRTCTGALPVSSFKSCATLCPQGCPAGTTCSSTGACVAVHNCPPETHWCNGACVSFTHAC
jgi:hypothetical protein